MRLASPASLALALVPALALAGCATQDATLEVAGEGGGERSRTLACEGEGGLADVVLSLSAHAQAGLVTVLVRDGLDAQVHERHVVPTSGGVEQERRLSGAPGAWTLEERRTEDFRGELRASLVCGA